MPHFLFTLYWPIYLEWHYFKMHTVCYGVIIFIFNLPHWANNSTAISSIYAILECLQSWKGWKYRHWLFPFSAHLKCSAEESVPSLHEGEKLATQRCLNSWLPVKETSIKTVSEGLFWIQKNCCAQTKDDTLINIFLTNMLHFFYLCKYKLYVLAWKNCQTFLHAEPQKRKFSPVGETVCGYCAVELFHRRHFDTSQEEMHRCT